MKNKRRFFLTILTVLLLNTSSFAQDFHNGIGFRLGGIAQGLTVKHMFNERSAFEGIASFGRRSLLLTALYERHNPVGDVAGLKWFYGGGAHIGFYNDGYHYFYLKGKHNQPVWIEETRNEVGLGADFIIGMEYKFQKAPISLGLDLKPFVDINSDFFAYWDGALSVRFTF